MAARLNMNNFLPIAVLFAALLSCCTGAAVADPKPQPGAAYTPADYKGPELAAKCDGAELQVSVKVQTGGYGFELRETGRAADHTFVKITLIAPGEGEVVTQALETKVLRVQMKKETGPVQVLLQQIQRGANYIVDPEFVLAKIVPR